MFRTLALGLLALTAGAQTQVDLRTQAKGIDFTAATSTKPVKTGAVLPASCATGEMFFKTDAPAGANLYACTAANTWSAQGGSGPSSCQDRGAVNAYACSPTPAVASYAVARATGFGRARAPPAPPQ